jgi:hypothetical protein
MYERLNGHVGIQIGEEESYLREDYLLESSFFSSGL